MAMEKTPKAFLATALVGVSLAGCMSESEEKLDAAEVGCEPNAMSLASIDYSKDGNIQAETISARNPKNFLRAENSGLFVLNPVIIRCGEETTYYIGVMDERTLFGIPAENAQLHIDRPSDGESETITIDDPSVRRSSVQKLGYKNNCAEYEQRLAEIENKFEAIDLPCAPSSLEDSKGNQFGVMP
jgi:hypothetical protein